MTMWRPTLSENERPLYLGIARAISHDVESGTLPPGTRLPPHRELAEALGVTVGTVSRAYAEAKRQGLLSGEIGRGSFVRGPSEPAAFGMWRAGDPWFIDLGLNLPPPPNDELAGILARTVRALSDRADLPALTAYQPEPGAPRHRAAGARWLGLCGIAADPGQVLVCCGAQHAMAVTFAAITDPGDTVMTEALTFPGMKAVASLLRLRLRGLPLDEEGIEPQAFEAACRRRESKVLYCVPTLQNPTTGVMGLKRREAIAGIARKHGVLIVEDDVHALLAPEPLPPLATLVPDQTFYIASTAKTLLPGLRTAFLLSPRHKVEALALRIQATVWMATPLTAEIVARWVEDGTAQRVLELRREEAQARERLAREILGALPHRSHPSSPHLWLTLPPPWRREVFASRARHRGVGVTSAEVFDAGGATTPQAVRVCLGAARDRKELEKGLGILKEIALSPGDEYPSIV